MSELTLVSQAYCFGGWQKRYTHFSEALNCDMNVSVFLPPHARPDSHVPALYWLSGLTCTDENFVTKAAAQQMAARLGMAIIAPDTSPRGENIPDAGEGEWDLGQGAGFYVNATQKPWSDNYKMYDYVVSELPALLKEPCNLNGLAGISGTLWAVTAPLL